MRDKFSELMANNSSSSYVNIVQDLPSQDPISRIYNNIFSIPSDTHMSQLQDGTRVITGHMVNTPQWDRFTTANYWGGINFHNNDFWCLSDFLYKQGLTGCKETINGDVVYKIIPMPEPQNPSDMAVSYTTSESQIPHPVRELVSNGDVNKFYECMKGNINDTVKSLNESLYIKGNNWSVNENKIIGLIGDKVINLQ